MTAKPEDINDAAKFVLREDNKYVFDEPPGFDDAMPLEDLIRDVQKRLNMLKLTKPEDDVCVSGALQKLLGNYSISSQPVAIQKLEPHHLYWIKPKMDDEDASFNGVISCGIKREILDKRANKGTSATKAELITIIGSELGAQGREVYKKDIELVLENLKSTIESHLCEDGPGVFTFTDLFTIKVEPNTRNVSVEPLEGLIMMARSKK